MSYSFLWSMPLSVSLSHQACTARRVIGALADFPSGIGMPSILQDGTTPAGQVARLLVFRHFRGLLESSLKVGLYVFALAPATKKIPPKDLAKRRRFLGVPAGAPQFARQRAERIV